MSTKNFHAPRIALVGLGGYGHHYLRLLLDPEPAREFQFVAGIDPKPEGSQFFEEIKTAQIPIYASLAEFYEADRADLVVIAAPIHLHLPLTQLALRQGASVLCEKPVAGTVQEAEAMAQAEAEAAGFVTIGYQWSFSEPIQALKSDVIGGKLGRPLRFKTKVFWPRPAAYFQRNRWAARIKTDGGQWVLDSPVNNATAHHLHNMFYVLGETRETSARPVDVQAELYRANPVQNYDAAALRAHTASGTEILFFTAHPVHNNRGPALVYEFEQAVVEFDLSGHNHFVARFHDGRTKDYGNPDENYNHKLWQSLETLESGAPLACGIETAMAQTICMNGAQESMPQITVFPETMIRRDGEGLGQLTWVDGLEEAFEACYDQHCLPSEGDFAWARSGEQRDLRDYRIFPSFVEYDV